MMPEEVTERPICIVEDSPPVRNLMEVLLAREGFSVVSFGRGEEVIDWLRHHRPLALLCDLVLPDIHGVEILRVLRSLPEGNKIPAIAVTGLSQESERQHYLQMGFDAYIVKPLSVATFAPEVQRVIKRKQAVESYERL